MHRRLRRVVATVASGVLAIALAGSSAPAASPSKVSKPKTVKVKQFNFKPTAITVSVGDTVRWKNKDEILHTITARGDDPLFDEELDGEGTTVKITFDDPGTYRYFCSRHTGMNGKVVVE
jgi:plastocyanin